MDKHNRRYESQKKLNQENNFLIQQEQFMNLKRKKLSNLLNSEELQYRNEIINNQETSDDVKRRMERELMELRKERLSQENNDIQKLNEKRFYDSADELRKNDSQAFAFECYLEQENQMLEKMKRREKEKQEEMFYVKLNEFDTKKKIENEKKDEIKQKNKLKNIYDYQQWQRDQKNQEMQHNYEINQLENERLKEQWRRDKESDERNERNRKEMNIQVYKDIEYFNKREEEDRKKKLDIEKMKDKQLIDSIVAKEQALDLIDKQEKERKIKEFHENKKEAELWMDKIAQEEADKEYKKEMEEWKKQEDKRIQLLKDVYKGREDALKYKKQQIENEKNIIKQERQDLDQKVNEYYNYLEQIKKNEAEKRKTHQNQLRYQIQEKDRLRKREMQDKLYEERAAQLWEQDYQNKIDEQRALHLKRLQAIKEKNSL